MAAFVLSCDISDHMQLIFVRKEAIHWTAEMGLRAAIKQRPAAFTMNLPLSYGASCWLHLFRAFRI
jgi:hypothetical protein